jgi:hypothetical protein
MNAPSAPAASGALLDQFSAHNVKCVIFVWPCMSWVQRRHSYGRHIWALNPKQAALTVQSGLMVQHEKGLNARIEVPLSPRLPRATTLQATSPAGKKLCLLQIRYRSVCP